MASLETLRVIIIILDRIDNEQCELEATITRHRMEEIADAVLTEYAPRAED